VEDQTKLVAEKKMAEKIARKRIAPEHLKTRSLPVQFPTLLKGMALQSINGEEVQGKKYGAIRNKLFKGEKPQKLVFFHYPYTRDLITHMWTPFNIMKKEGRFSVG
jgi:hypothetical protein